jgi:hypothetical protein
MIPQSIGAKASQIAKLIEQISTKPILFQNNKSHTFKPK